MYLNGNMLAIFWKNVGKNGSGNTNPDNISETTINIFTIPFSSSVNKQIIWYKSTKNVINKDDSINDMINIINLGKVIDKSKLKGAGKSIAIIITGKNLNVALDNLSPNILDAHII